MPTCKLSTKILPATCAWGVLLICTGLFFAFICPFYVYEYTVGIAVYQTILTIFVISNFGFSTFMDPGVYPKASNELVRDGDMPVPLHKTVEINKVTVRMKWCTTCKFYRPPRSSHCSMCDCCIEVFDHHCPWVNNCVGRRNYRFFFQFLVSLSLHIISIFTLCLFFVLKSNEDIKTAPKIISLVLMAIIGILSIPIVGLTCFHVVLIGRGRTTNEQVTGKMRGTKNPFDMGCIRNCCYLFCGPTWPGLLRNNSWMTGSKAVLLSGASYNASDSVVRIYMETSNTSSHRGNKSDYNKMMQMNSREAQEVLHSQKPLLHHHQPTESFEANNLIHAPQGYNRGQQQPHQKPSMTAPIFSYPNGGYPLIHSPIGTNSMAPAPLAVVASAQQSHLLYTQQQQQQQQQFHQQQHIQQFQQLNRNHHHHHHHHQYPSMPVETKHHGPDRAGRNKSPAMPLRASSRQASAASVVPSNFHRPEGACLLSCDDRKSSKHHPNSMPHQQRQKQAGYERSQQQAYHSKRSTVDRKDSDITEYKV